MNIAQEAQKPKNRGRGLRRLRTRSSDTGATSAPRQCQDSGDGDFRRLVECVQRKGVRVSVVSTVASNPPMAADELRRQADTFIELQELAPAISRPPNGRENGHGRPAAARASEANAAETADLRRSA